MPKARVRARQVCEKCHTSKVKCDVAQTGFPCTRCKRLRSECTLFESRRVSLKPPSAPIDIQPVNVTADADISDSSSPVTLRQRNGSSSGSVGTVDQFSDDGHDSDMEWASVIDYFMKHRKEIIDKNSITFFGESSPLTSLMLSLRESGHISLQHGAFHSIPASKDETDKELLASRGAFALPEKSALNELLSYFFKIVHPFYPIFNRCWFESLYKKGEVSLLLMNSICLAACYHCPTSAIFKVNFGSRKQAKRVFYNRAKLLFDFNYEKDRLTVLQSAFFMSFWCGSPNDIWNSRTWHGVAVNIAEDLGMHRSTVNSNMKESDKCLLKVIWWCLCNRDVMSALTFGRPPRINLQQCDVPPLEISDCAADTDPYDVEMYGSRDPVQGHYLTELSKLNCLLRYVFDARYNPGCPQSMEMNWKHHSKFTEWRNSLPKEIDWDRDWSSENIFSMCLCLFFHHHITFIYRPLTSDMVSSENCSLDTSVESASQIALIGSKISTLSLMARVPQDAYATFVVAMVILAIESATRDDKNAAIKLQLCKMVLQQGAGYWDHASWLINVFNRINSYRSPQDIDSAISAPSDTPAELLLMTPSSTFLRNWLAEFCDQEYTSLFR